MREGGKGEDEGEGGKNGISLLHFAYCKKLEARKTSLLSPNSYGFTGLGVDL